MSPSGIIPRIAATVLTTASRIVSCSKKNCLQKSKMPIGTSVKPSVFTMKSREWRISEFVRFTYFAPFAMRFA